MLLRLNLYLTTEGQLTKACNKKKRCILVKASCVCCCRCNKVVIGKQGLAYRASNESAFTFDNLSLNHGNLLEIILLLSNYDSDLAKHVTKITQMMKTALLKSSDDTTSKARGEVVISHFSAKQLSITL